LAESVAPVLTLDPLDLEASPEDLPGVLRALARRPALFEEVEALLGRARAALDAPSPSAWLAVMKALEALGRLPDPGLPVLSSPLPSRSQGEAFLGSLEKAVSRFLSWRYLVGEFRRRMGGRKALTGRVLAESADLLERALGEGALRPKARLLSTSSRFEEDRVELPEAGMVIPSRSLVRFFRGPALADEEAEFREAGGGEGREGPERVVLFAATIGPGMEELARAAFGRGEPFAGTVLDALASTLAEGAARAVSREAARRGLLGPGGPGCVARRYHSGYGDWGLPGQADLFRVLEPGKIGISLSESFLMVPEKSVAGLAAWKRRLS